MWYNLQFEGLVFNFFFLIFIHHEKMPINMFISTTLFWAKNIFCSFFGFKHEETKSFLIACKFWESFHVFGYYEQTLITNCEFKRELFASFTIFRKRAKTWSFKLNKFPTIQWDDILKRWRQKQMNRENIQFSHIYILMSAGLKRFAHGLRKKNLLRKSKLVDFYTGRKAIVWIIS